MKLSTQTLYIIAGITLFLWYQQKQKQKTIREIGKASADITALSPDVPSEEDTLFPA